MTTRHLPGRESALARRLLGCLVISGCSLLTAPAFAQTEPAQATAPMAPTEPPPPPPPPLPPPVAPPAPAASHSPLELTTLGAQLALAASPQVWAVPSETCEASLWATTSMSCGGPAGTDSATTTSRKFCPEGAQVVG